MKKIVTLILCYAFMALNAHAGDKSMKDTIVVLETTQGPVELKLFPEIAPKTCENFVELIKKGYYDGITFHRVIKNFMIQGGDPTGTGRGGNSIWNRPFEDECVEGVKFDKPGILAMANAGPNTNGSQFFITTVPTPWLNQKHTIFGEVIKGYENVRKIENQPTDSQGRPDTPQKIIKAYPADTAAALPPRAGTEILYETSYVCRDRNGAERWRAAYEIRRKDGNIYSMVEKGRGYYFGFKGKISWVEEAGFGENGNTIKPLWMKKRISDASGKEIVVQEQIFDFKENTVTCIHKDLVKNTSEQKKFKFKENIVNRILQGLYVQKFIENKETRKQVQFISPEPALYNLEIRLLGTEEINIDGQKIKAYKLCMDPMLGILNFVKAFLPKAYVWHSANPKFEWLKYEGVENSIKSPEVVITTLDKIPVKQ